MLKQIREAAHLTQSELASRIGASRVTVARWEQGKCLPQPYWRAKLHEFFGEEITFMEEDEPPDSKATVKDLENTYFVQDREEEKQRLRKQAPLIRNVIGGLMPEIAHPERFKRVLDVGCGTGAWLIELAQTYPQNQFIGIDISQRMIDDAQKQAESVGVNNIEFRVMDALHRIDFPGQSFDLVNHRLGMSWIRTWDWKPLITEYKRLCLRDGVIRIVESDVLIESNSQALTSFSNLFQHALFAAGNLFTNERDSMPLHLPARLRELGLHNQFRLSNLDIYGGTPSATSYVDVMHLLFQSLKPFLQKWTPVPDTYEETCEQAMRDILRPDFAGHAHFITVWSER